MSVRSNGYFNNPAFAQAAGNLMSLFAPPSGADAAGWATANAKKAEAARLAQFYDYATSPEFNQSTFDRMGVGAGAYAPNQSYYSVDQGNATTRRGQDITAATARSNNAADNVRALQDRQMQEAAAMERLGVTDATTRRGQDVTASTSLENNRLTELGKLYSPLAQGQVRPAIPADIAGMYGVGRGLPAEQGLPKPLSETEYQALQQSRLQASGQLTDQMMIDAIVGKETPVQALGPDGKPLFMSPGAAVREGAQPFVNKGAEAKPTNAVALMPDGKTRVPAVQDETGKWVHAQTGQILPDGIQIFDLPKAQGSAADVGLAPTTANQTQANNQEAEVTRSLKLLDLYENTLRQNPGAVGLAGVIRGVAQNAAATASDLAAAFGQVSPELGTAAVEIRDGLRGIAPEYFDPSIPEVDFLQGALAYSLARTENPQGEVSRQAFQSALSRVKGGGFLANTQSALAAVKANRDVLTTQHDSIRTLRAPGTGRTDTAFQPPVDETVKVRRYNPATGRIE